MTIWATWHWKCPKCGEFGTCYSEEDAIWAEGSHEKVCKNA